MNWVIYEIFDHMTIFDHMCGKYPTLPKGYFYNDVFKVSSIKLNIYFTN
jgi:hypothetical protein